MAFLTINGVAYGINRRATATRQTGDVGGALEHAGGAIRWAALTHTYVTAPLTSTQDLVLRAVEGTITPCGGDAFGGVATDCHVAVAREWMRDQAETVGYRIVATLTLTEASA